MKAMRKKHVVRLVTICLILALMAGCEEKEELPETGTETVETTREQRETSAPERHSLYEGETQYFYDQLSKEEKAFFYVLKKQAEAFYWGTQEPKTKETHKVEYRGVSYSGLNEKVTQGYFGNLELGTLTEMEAKKVAIVFYHSCPKYFFLSGMLVEEDGNYYMELLDGLTSREEIDSYRDKIEEKTQEWMKVIEKGENDLEKEEAILQLIYDNVEYDSSRSGEMLLRNGVTGGIGGALCDGLATVDGYAKTFQYLCNAAGLDSLIVWATADSYNAWNMVKLYDDWYCIDVGWLDVIKMDSPADSQFNKAHDSFKKIGGYASAQWMTDGRYITLHIQLPQCIRDTVEGGPELCSVQDEAGRYVIEHGLLTQYQVEDGEVMIPANAMELDIPIVFSDEEIQEIRSFSVEEGSEYLCAEDGVLFDVSREKLMRYPNAGASEYVVPEGTKILSKMAFVYCSKLETIHIPASITEIRYYAFGGCESLKDIYFEGTKDQWDAIDQPYSGIPDYVTVHYQ